MQTEPSAGRIGVAFESKPPKLLVPVDPLPGEGLPELVLRATASNFYHNTAMVLKLAGLSGRFPAGISGQIVGREAAIAEFFGLSGGADALINILQKQETGSAWHSFFGTTIRAAHRHVIRRRVSPRALSTSLHCRAVWSLRVLGFCPNTLEELIECCPICRKPLNWATAKGIAHCSFCGNADEEGYWSGLTDLRDHPQRLIEIEDIEALTFVTGLIDPDPDVRANFHPTLHDDLRTADRGDLWEFATALAYAASTLLGMRHQVRVPQRTRHVLPPEAIAAAGRVLLTWPQGLHDLADRLRQQEGMMGEAGHPRREAKTVALLRNDPHLSPKLSLIVNDLLARDGPAQEKMCSALSQNLLPLTAAARKYGFSFASIGKAIDKGLVPCHLPIGVRNAPVMVEESAVAALLAIRDDCLHPSVAANRLGIPQLALASLFDHQYLQMISTKLDNLGNGKVSKASLNDLLVKCGNAVLAESPPKDAVPLRAAACYMGTLKGNPWPSIFAAIIGGSVETWSTNKSGPLSKSLHLKLDELHRLGSEPWHPGTPGLPISRSDASHLLATTDPVIYRLMQLSLLQRRLDLSQLEAFAEDYLLTAQIRTTLQSSGIRLSRGETVTWLKDRGLRPINASDVRGFIWRRCDTEKVLRSCLSSPPPQMSCH